MTHSTQEMEPVFGFEFDHGDRIRLAREKRGWTQDELAEISAVSRASIVNYEGGKPMRKLQRRALALALGVSDEWIEFGERRAESRRPDGPDGGGVPSPGIEPGPSAYMDDVSAIVLEFPKVA